MTASGIPHPVALLDANVLYPAPLRDFFMWQAVNDVFTARWTDDIHEEWIGNLLDNRADLSCERLQRTRRLMDAHVEGVPVTGYEKLINGLALPDPGDRHVLAAAIACCATHIVTQNVDDFPVDRLSPHGIEPLAPDVFGLLLFGRTPGEVVRAAREHWRSLQSPPKSKGDYLADLERIGLPATSGRLAEHM